MFVYKYYFIYNDTIFCFAFVITKFMSSIRLPNMYVTPNIIRSLTFLNYIMFDTLKLAHVSKAMHPL